MPKSLLVMGSGAIGIEFASFYRTMGAEVTVVEVMPQILPVEDAEIAAMARKRFEKQGIKILTSAKVTKVEKGAQSITATIETDKGSQQITADKLISAVGVVGNVEGLGLEALGVKMERGLVATDGLGRTNVPGIYAIGDVAGPPMLAHKAEHEGVICVETIAGLHTHPMDKGMIPGCTYCHPQVASVGLTEAKAKEQGLSVKVGRFPFAGNGKAIALGEPDGMVKTIFDAKTGKLLGAHMVGAEVTELIQGFVVALGLETTEEELMHTVFPHPTLSEMMHESVLDAYGRVIHT
jgi:dihydrolipoamide dehydrogenase